MLDGCASGFLPAAELFLLLHMVDFWGDYNWKRFAELQDEVVGLTDGRH